MRKIDAVEIARQRRLKLLKGKINAGQVLTAAEIGELGRFELMTTEKKKGKDARPDPVEQAQKRRYLFLLEKVKGNKRLSVNEVKELKKYEAQRQAANDVLETAAEAAAYAGVSRWTIQNWAKKGLARLEGKKYSKQMIDAFVERMAAEKKKQAEDKKQKKAADKKHQAKKTPGPKKANEEKPTEYTGLFLTAAERELEQETVDDWDLLSETEKDRRRKDKKRKAERDLTIPAVKDWDRRRHALTNWQIFCKTYFPEIFYNPFSKDQVELGNSIVATAMSGSKQADAEERGGGKSTLSKIVSGVYLPLKGIVKYLVLLGANGPFAEGLLSDIKDFYEFSDLLCEDFPEVCIPIRSLDGAAQRAGAQTVNGERTRLQWSGREIILPIVKDKHGTESPASGVIITTRGIDAAIRGLVKGSKRPDFVIGDDLETRDSARSSIEIAKRLAILESDVVGLQGPGRKMGILVIGTIIRKGCVIEQLTDRKLNPAWHGIRKKRLIAEPENTELWTRYMQMRKEDQRDGDITARRAHRFYLDNRKEMDKGAVVSNEYRFRGDLIDDDSLKGDDRKLEVSALQSCFNDICDMGRDHFDTEYQNTPPESSADGVGIEASHVQRKLSGVPRGVVPKGCSLITAAIDIRRREFHWSVVAWKPGAIGYIIDYGFGEIQSPQGSLLDDAIKMAQEQAILTALRQFYNELMAAGGYPDEDTGELRQINFGVVDAGWMWDAVQQFCVSTSGRFKPIRGLGTNQIAGKNYRKPKNHKLPSGQHWHAEMRPQTRQVYYALDVDPLKQMVHEGFLLGEGQNGGLWMFGDDPIVHSNFADHILAEVWQSEFVEGKGLKEGWLQLHSRNHWLDTAGYNFAAAEMKGITVLKKAVVRRKKRRFGGSTAGAHKIRTNY